MEPTLDDLLEGYNERVKRALPRLLDLAMDVLEGRKRVVIYSTRHFEQETVHNLSVEATPGFVEPKAAYKGSEFEEVS